MIKIVLNHLTRRNTKTSLDIFGDIHFKIDGYCFPSEDWDDFVYPILSWWKEQLRQMIDNANDSCELFFMDGPYFVTIHDRGETVDMDFIMRDQIDRTITGINKAELCTVVDEALESLDIPQLNE